MSTATEKQQDLAAGSSGWGRTWDVCALVLPLLAMAPLVKLQIEAIAARQERWFSALLPLFVLLAIPLVFRKKADVPPMEEEEGGFFRAIKLAITGTAQTKPLLDRPPGPPTQRRARAAILVVCSALILYLVAVLWSAPWLASVSAIGAFGGWALGRFPRVHWPAVAAWCGLLLLALPLPGNWDDNLLGWMQGLAGLLAGGVLDLLQVPHLRYGNLIELQEFVLNLETACRGPLSFYALVVLAAITIYLRGNGLATSLLKFLTLPIWGILLYTLRVLIIVLAQHWYARDLTAGSDYLLVAAASLAWAYFGYLLWDLFLSTALGPVPPEVPELAKYYNRLNKWLCWPNEVPIEDISSSLAFERSNVNTTPLTAGNKTDLPVVNWWRAPALAWLLMALLLSAGFAGVTAGAVAFRGSGLLSGAIPVLTAEQLAGLPEKEALPETVETWLRTGFRIESAEAPRKIGPQCRSWNYLSGTRQAVFQIDLPLRGWTDLAHWYAQRGWELEELVLVPGKLNPDWPWIEMTIVNSFGVKARVCHSVLTSSGKPYLGHPVAKSLNPEDPVQPRQSLTAELRQLAGEPPPVTLQIQLFSDTLDVTKKLDLAEFRQLYEQLREQLVKDQAQRSWTFGFEN